MRTLLIRLNSLRHLVIRLLTSNCVILGCASFIKSDRITLTPCTMTAGMKLMKVAKTFA